MDYTNTYGFISGLLELCLSLNSTPSIPPELRFNLHQPAPASADTRGAPGIDIDPNITPEHANGLFAHHNNLARHGQLPPHHLQALRDKIDSRLAAQEVESLQSLAGRVAQPLPSAEDNEPNDGDEGNDTSWLSPDAEEMYLARVDARCAPDHYALAPSTEREKEREALAKEAKHWAELTPRELERQVELMNPQSQHNWLKIHWKTATNIGGGDDDADSVASHDAAAGGAPKSSRKRAGAKDKNLAKQVGDRAVERAREGMSPSMGEVVGGEEDELALGMALPMDEGAMSARKKGRDPDGTYRLKGGKGAAGAGKAKRKRSGEDLGIGAEVKKARVEGE